MQIGNWIPYLHKSEKHIPLRKKGMITRVALRECQQLLKGFKAIAIVGPRQSGKTTLAKMVAGGRPYLSFENPDVRLLFENDPRGFLKAYEKTGAIFDEAQYVPNLFSYLQEILDNTKKNGKYILTGSNNFSLIEKIAQSLAGRIVYLDLLPLSIAEFKQASLSKSVESFMLTGGYPAVAVEKRNREKWFQSYIRNYLERDVRLIKNISNFRLFQRFIFLCAGRVGQLLNFSNLSNEVGVDKKTIESWIGVLEASYIIHLLPPYHENFNKRVIKSPKLYFVDTGLACFMLGIRSEKEIFTSPYKGALFENFIIMELLKNRYNKGQRSNLYFFRDSNGNEVDVLIQNGKKIIPIEIKSAETFTSEFLKGLNYWQALSPSPKSYLVYGGKTESTIKTTDLVSWKNVDTL